MSVNDQERLDCIGECQKEFFPSPETAKEFIGRVGQAILEMGAEMGIFEHYPVVEDSEKCVSLH